MTTRTTTRTVTFVRPFMLGELSEQFPAGRYSIETDEELLEGVSFPAYQRTATTMQLVADPRHPGITEFATIDPLQLEAALAAETAQLSIAGFAGARPPMAPGSTEDGVQLQESVASFDLIKAEP